MIPNAGPRLAGSVLPSEPALMVRTRTGAERNKIGLVNYVIRQRETAGE